MVISCSVLREPGVRQPGARADGFTTLNVGGDDVHIYRDEFGVPHIFATTNRGLFAAYGYAGGPKDYLGRTMSDVHRGMNIGEVYGHPRRHPLGVA